MGDPPTDPDGPPVDPPTDPFPTSPRPPTFDPDPPSTPPSRRETQPTGRPRVTAERVEDDLDERRKSRVMVGKVVARVFKSLSAHGVSIPGAAHKQAIDDLESAIGSGELHT